MKTSGKLLKAAKLPALITMVLLLVPLLAMQFTNEVRWDETDFVVAGLLLFGTGFSYKLIAMQSKNIIYRAAVATALGAGLFLIWSNLAVGIIGSEDNVGNLMYFGIILVLIASTFTARFRPKGMAIALFVTALAQGLTIAIALLSGMQHYPHSSVYEIIIVNGFFITLFLISAGLFWYAAGQTGRKSETVA